MAHKKMTAKQFNKIAAVAFLVAVAIAGGLMLWGVNARDAASAAEAEQVQAEQNEASPARKGELVADTNKLPTEGYKAEKAMLSKEMEQKRQEDAQAAADQAQAQALQDQVAQQSQQAQEDVAVQPEDGAHDATLDTTKQHYATVAGSSGHTDVSEQTNGSISTKTPDQAPNTINILGETIPFADAYLVKRAPEHGAGIWKGDDPVDDGQMCYFVGHNPGDFHNVMRLRDGNKVTVSDSNGHIKTYTVHDVFTVPQASTYSKIAERVEGHGESVVMQTCCGDNVNVRVVVAW